MSNFKEILKNVKAFAFDIDGVLSTTKVYAFSSGEMVRTMNIRDGYAMQYAIKKKYPIAIISGGISEAVRERFLKLGITDIYMGSSDKKGNFLDFISKYNLDQADVLYMGDDIPDIEILEITGVPTCPSDAVEEVKAICKYISDKPGGDGCVRDVMEQVLKLHGNWLDTLHLKW